MVDGAAATVAIKGDDLRDNDIVPDARFLASATIGVPPHIMGIGPVAAIQKLCDATQSTLSDIDLIEINEAFGAQTLACMKELDLSHDRVNVNGGAIALGHPLAATGLRCTMTLARALKQRGGGRGIASACIGGGQGIAMCVEVD
jgi:acetyl-CoA C-acetyltransferase